MESTALEGNEFGSGPGDKKRKKRGQKERPGSGAGMEEGFNSSSRKEDKNYQRIAVAERLSCIDVNKGEYIYNFIVPFDVNQCKLQFNIAGEQTDYALPIKEASIINEQSQTYISKIENENLYLHNLVKDENIRIKLNVDFDSFCMMEVEYYANKK